MDYILQTNSLTKRYKNFQALNDLTMNVPKGSIYELNLKVFCFLFQFFFKFFHFFY